MKGLRGALVAILVFAFCNMAIGQEQEEEFPLGYPWSSWGEITETPVGHQETGLKIDGYVEQGIDWFKLGKTDWKFNTFVGLRGTASTRKMDYFDNKVGPWAGLKFKKILELDGESSATLYLGVRWEYYRYLESAPLVSHRVILGTPVKDDHRVTFFFEWGFDGDWKKHKNKENNKESNKEE